MLYRDDIEERRIRREENRRRRRKQERIRRMILGGLTAVIGIAVIATAVLVTKRLIGRKQVDPADVAVPEYVNVNLLTPNEYSRPQIPLEKVNGIALENRNYFEGLKDQTGSKTTSVSSHFVIGLEGEVVQCVPLNEVAYASNNRNSDTISIECCHPDETGKFYDSTYQTLVNLCAYLCVEFDLKPDDVIRHYDVTGKICPKYFVDYPEKWEDFHKDVKKAIKILKK